MDNPSAFPHQHRASDSKVIEQYSDYGLSMRDYFASAAMHGFLASGQVPQGELKSEIAAESYAMADAMLEERTKR